MCQTHPEKEVKLFIHLMQEHNQNINLQERWLLKRNQSFSFLSENGTRRSAPSQAGVSRAHYVQGMPIRIPDSELSSGVAGGNARVCLPSPSQRGPSESCVCGFSRTLQRAGEYTPGPGRARDAAAAGRRDSGSTAAQRSSRQPLHTQQTGPSER